MRRVTVVGERWARPGARFYNEQPCEVAEACPVAKACQNLPYGREYDVVAVRPVHHASCVVHEAGARVVEVVEAPLRATLDRSKTRGTAARWSPPVCHIRGCANWDRCFPHGVEAGREYVLERVEEALKCPMGHQLVGVQLREPGAAAPR
jgi:uncharacterized protein